MNSKMDCFGSQMPAKSATNGKNNYLNTPNCANGFIDAKKDPSNYAIQDNIDKLTIEGKVLDSIKLNHVEHLSVEENVKIVRARTELETQETGYDERKQTANQIPKSNILSPDSSLISPNNSLREECSHFTHGSKEEEPKEKHCIAPTSNNNVIVKILKEDILIPTNKDHSGSSFPVTEKTLQSSNYSTKKSEPKDALFAHLAIAKLWLVFLLTFIYCGVMTVASYTTSSLTLRIEAYHALYNTLALGGCLITMKICRGPQSLKNTFGWARLEVVSCLCTLLFIASLCFSVTLESIQIAAQAGHQEPMLQPLAVIGLSSIGLCLNVLVFCIIGGYTHHQGCFLKLRRPDYWGKGKLHREEIQVGTKTKSGLFFPDFTEVPLPQDYQGIKGIIRDISGLVLTMICAAIIYLLKDDSLILYIDPLFAVASIAILLVLSYPFGKECCQILLQTIPESIDIQKLSASILEEIPEIINIHHLHIWSLSPGKVVATAHVVYSNPKVYKKTFDALEQLFLKKDITHVTLQPEFLHLSGLRSPGVENGRCLLRCKDFHCREKECCQLCPAAKASSKAIISDDEQDEAKHHAGNKSYEANHSNCGHNHHIS